MRYICVYNVSNFKRNLLSSFESEAVISNIFKLSLTQEAPNQLTPEFHTHCFKRVSTTCARLNEIHSVVSEKKRSQNFPSN